VQLRDTALLHVITLVRGEIVVDIDRDERLLAQHA